MHTEVRDNEAGLIGARMLRVVLGIGLVIAIVGIAYCAMGLIQLASYSAGPNYPKELATKHFWYWLFALSLSISLGVSCFAVLYRTKNKQQG